MNKQLKNFSIGLSVHSGSDQESLEQHFGIEATYFSPANTILPNGRHRPVNVWSNTSAFENREPNEVFAEYFDLIKQKGLPEKSVVKLTFLFADMAEVFPLVINMAYVAQLIQLGIKVEFDDVLVDEVVSPPFDDVEGYRVVVTAGQRQNERSKVYLVDPDEIEDVLRANVRRGYREHHIFCFENWPGLIFEDGGDLWEDSKITLFHVLRVRPTDQT